MTTEQHLLDTIDLMLGAENVDSDDTAAQDAFNDFDL